jgi:CBS domain-containing protein
MEENNVAAVAVCEGGVLVGIITERDIVRAAADAAPFDRTPVEDYMTASPVVFSPDDDPAAALAAMLDGGFRHVPVVDDDDVVGVLTMRSIVARTLVPAPA